MTAATPSSFFPGMGDLPADNPMLSGMALMRQVWGGLSGAGQLAQGLPLSPTLDAQELARRIDELRTVENWLNLNLSLLRSTIQGMEVQRATISTLQSFLGGAVPGADASARPASPDVPPKPQAGQAAQDNAEAASEDPAAQAAQAWWSLLQQQFQGFAAAASAAAAPVQAAAESVKAVAAPAASAAPPAAAPQKRAARPASKRAAPAKQTSAPAQRSRKS
ncbi:hypothetical protein EV679_0388 [Kerstersia gyiorum]|uniref:Uncharacterized protein n=2 Tax=Kerstersia gyiorum TaxID=206506 RepID=A0A4Q7N0W9_9BURK|nr:PhaM family polyhydroxyalkanoate granule multifunctional regulatory protein [Kerstersia gyiorum]KAB0544214.1 transcriptional regulator [Kerstersia gyiorum]RZS73199.1 hypothetical protein EV679_0388 [Kerstersia gyiorum]